MKLTYEQRALCNKIISERKALTRQIEENRYILQYASAPAEHIAINVGKWREENVAKTNNVEALKVELFSKYQSLVGDNKALDIVTSFYSRYSQIKRESLFLKACEEDEIRMNLKRVQRQKIYEATKQGARENPQ